MDNLKIEIFKKNLEEELSLLEKELNSVGRKNPDNKNDWEAEPADFDTDSADETESADKIEEYEENSAILKELEIRYNDTKDALSKIESGKYGLCEVCNSPIEADRLEANNSARTCKSHMN